MTIKQAIILAIMFGSILYMNQKLDTKDYTNLTVYGPPYIVAQ